MTTVILTEKPSVAQDIAAVLGVKAKSKFHIEAKDGSFITWARGHLLELVEPEEYDKSWGGYWNWGQLPMIPAQWKYRVVRGSGDHVKAIAALLKKASTVVIATDAGREGELIGRLLVEYCKFRGEVKRFWTSEMTPAGIKKALANLRPGKEFEPLCEAAKARQHSDWIYGLTGTRAVTLASRVRGESFSLGRVQTPTLALVVRRDATIAGFEAATYYELEARMKTASGESFVMKYAPAEADRITDKSKAEALMAKALNAQGPLKVEKEPGVERPPLPFSLPKLQRLANRTLGYSADKTLKIAQKLYEKKFTTYPRTDCEYLSVNQKPEVGAVLDGVRASFPSRVAALEAQGAVLRDSVFDDSKLSDHHAIIPTYLVAHGLEAEEQKLYELICLRYLQTLSQDMQYDQTKVTMDANGVVFKAADRVISFPGWQAIASA